MSAQFISVSFNNDERLTIIFRYTFDLTSLLHPKLLYMMEQGGTAFIRKGSLVSKTNPLRPA